MVSTVRHLAVVLLLVVASTSTAIGAAPQEDPAYDRARELYSAGDYGAAAELLADIYERAKNPFILVNLGQCYEHLDQWERAKSTYEAILAPETGAPPRLTTDARAMLAAVEAELARPVPFQIDVIPHGAGGALVTLADRTDAIPVERELPRGDYPVVVTARGYEKVRQMFTLAHAGDRLVVKLTPSPVKVRVAIDGALADGVQLEVPGIEIVPKRMSAVDLGFAITPGRYQLVCHRGGERREVALLVPLGPGGVSATCAFAAPASADPGWPPWALVGSGAAGLAVGVGLAVDALNKADQVNGSADLTCAGCESQSAAGWAVAGVGGALLIGGVLWLVLAADDATAPDSTSLSGRPAREERPPSPLSLSPLSEVLP